MLQSFYKYREVEMFKYVNNYNNHVNYKRKNNFCLTRVSAILYNASFMRKFYFRSLLCYLNIMYANLQQPVEINFFYIPKFVIMYYSSYHPSFYFKKRIKK